jgi:hypothetical protein
MDCKTSKAISEKYKNPFDSVRELLPGYKLGEHVYDYPNSERPEVTEFRRWSAAEN